MKKVLYFLIISMCLSLCPAGGFSGGNGRVENPYKLSNAADIKELSENEGVWGAVFELTADIDLAGEEINPFTQDLQNSFGGTVHGNGYAIKNLTFKGIVGRYVGLFGNLAATAVIKDIDLLDVHIDVTTPDVEDRENYLYVGALAGCSNAKIINCKVTGSIKVNAKKLTSVGGFCGRQYDGLINHCYSELKITAVSLDQCFAGGMIGYSHSANILNNISNCVIEADGSKRTYAGSICGYSLHSAFNSCCSDRGKIITACGGFSGGISGYCYNGQTVNCYAENAVFAFKKGFAGGLTGGNYNSIMKNCFFNGLISLEDSKSGAIAGLNEKSQILNCFWVYDTSLAKDAIAEGMFIGDVNMYTGKQISGGSIINAAQWNAETPKDAGKPLWQINERSLPRLNRVAQVSEKR